MALWVRKYHLVQLKATTQANMPVKDFEEIKKSYLLDLEVVMSMDEIPEGSL